MTQNIYPFSTQHHPKLAEVGGKPQSLIRSTQAGLQVPGGLALSVAFFKPWTEHVKSTDEWKALLANPVKANCAQARVKDGRPSATPSLMWPGGISS